MTDKTIAFIIDLINKGEAHELVFLRPLSTTVLISKTWISSENVAVCKNDAYDMFFVKNEKNLVVAAVLDMGRQDLHVYVKPEYRRNGFLVNALKEVILPYLFSTGRQEQHITFENPQAKHHAELVGFHFLSDRKLCSDLSG